MQYKLSIERPFHGHLSQAAYSRVPVQHYVIDLVINIVKRLKHSVPSGTMYQIV